MEALALGIAMLSAARVKLAISATRWNIRIASSSFTCLPLEIPRLQRPLFKNNERINQDSAIYPLSNDQ
jgi:hypothetical protein